MTLDLVAKRIDKRTLDRVRERAGAGGADRLSSPTISEQE